MDVFRRPVGAGTVMAAYTDGDVVDVPVPQAPDQF